MWNEVYRPLLVQVAATLGADPESLRAQITLESNWNPTAYNPSGAVGLIQFMPQTLKGMRLLSPAVAALVPDSGVVPEEVKQKVRAEFTGRYPTVEAQLVGPVLAYFLPGKPYPTDQSLWMQVFYPAARNVPPDTTFATLFQKYAGASWENRLAIFKIQNPGIEKVQDYLNLVKKKSRFPGLFPRA